MLACLPLIAAVAPAFAASPRVRDSGHGYGHINFTCFAEYDAVADGAGEIALQRPLTNHTLVGYGEVGVATRTEVLPTVPFSLLRPGEPTRGATIRAPGSLYGMRSEASGSA